MGLGIPVIDIGGLTSGAPGALDAVAREIHAACVDIGFFYIAGHGVPARTIDTLVDEARAFFHLPPDVKNRAAINRYHRGFSALGDATMVGAKRPDYKEFFTMALELPEDDPDVVAGEPLRGPNNWPSDQPTLRAAMTDYYDAVAECGAMLLRAVAVSLGAPADFFAAHYVKRLQRTQLIYYPPQPPALGADQFGVADHTDFGCVTLLWQDDIGGLEVLSRAGDWVQATPIPGTLVVNVGDLLGRWTNDRYVSTRHRVTNRSGKERFSIATFYDPSFKAVVDPRDLGASDADCRYEPVTAGEHITGRINASFGYRKKVA
jgi:isopenicillin N synthase-like dioxygenase